MGALQYHLASYKNTILLLSVLAITSTSLLLLALLRLAQILPTPAPSKTDDQKDIKPVSRPPASASNPTHLLVVLGSGGHTAEMLNILSSLPNLSDHFTQRTYLVSSGDSFSASKAVEFENQHVSPHRTQQSTHKPLSYSIVTVRRARRVHQSFLTTPFTTLLSLWDCISVLRGTHADFNHHKATSQTSTPQPHIYPDLILTNGPGTGVCVVLASLLLRFFGLAGSTQPPTPTSTSTKPPSHLQFSDQGQMRTIFIESWARIKTLSLSGKILRPLVNRFLVQWPQLAEIEGNGVEYIGPLVS